MAKKTIYNTNRDVNQADTASVFMARNTVLVFFVFQ